MPASQISIGQHAWVRNQLPAALFGAVASLGTWLLLVPWDLSEIDADGHQLDRGGDDYAGLIALVAGVVIVVAVGLVLAPRTRRSAVSFAVGGMVTWAALYAWRAGASETSGANMFMIPLLFAVIPVTVAAPFVLRSVTYRLEERGRTARRASRTAD